MTFLNRCLALATVAAAAAGPLVGQSAPLRATQQIAASVLALPAELRADATILGYGADGQLRTLRSGSGGMICLGPNPMEKEFHVACYHRSLEPFMARGRALRAAGLEGERVDSARFAEVRAGTLEMPAHPAALYSLFGPAGSFDPATGQATGAKPLYVVYIPGATPETTGIPATPAEGAPWIMAAGTPRAHIMFVPSMR
ncbi:MAG TPA: hypothetical protein VFM14_13450 [Gemmatimonadales bacterium]|nr:hypothetical protein [Gemmatimonadales bacterium]